MSEEHTISNGFPVRGNLQQSLRKAVMPEYRIGGIETTIVGQEVLPKNPDGAILGGASHFCHEWERGDLPYDPARLVQLRHE
jgi:hypothetical protein